MITRFCALLERVGTVLSGAALFSIMGLTFFDVLGRKFLDNSIPGSLELTELLMVVAIFGALPAVSRRSEHVQFDSLDNYLPAAIKSVQKVLVALIAAALLVGLAWLMWETGGQFSESGETTAKIRIPKAPFIYAMAIMCGLAAFMHVASIIGDRPKSSEQQEGSAL